MVRSSGQTYSIGTMLVEDRLIGLKSALMTGVIGAYEMWDRTIARQPIARSAAGSCRS